MAKLRRRFLVEGATALVAAGAFRPGRVEAAPAFDLVLRGGTVLDGTGAPAFAADVAIKGDAIAAVGEIAAAQGARSVEVAGLHVCPGFVDMHSHSDGGILVYPGAESRVRQGITTEITGNCGSSAAPLCGVCARGGAPRSGAGQGRPGLERRGLLLRPARACGLRGEPGPARGPGHAARGRRGCGRPSGLRRTR